MNLRNKRPAKKILAADNSLQTLEETFKRKKAETKFCGSIENLPVMFYVAEPFAPYSPIYVSPAFKIFGYSLRKWRESPNMWSSVIHPDDRDWVLKESETAMKSGREIDYEYRIIGKNGKLFWVNDRSYFVRDKSGQAIYWQGVMLDITERKEAEKALKASEERYRQMFERNCAVKLLIDAKTGNIIDANPAACDFYGYSHGDFKKKNISDLNTLSQSELFREMERAESERQKYFIFQHRLASGELRDVEIHSSPIQNNNQKLLYSIIYDITERRQAEASLKENEEQYRDLFENANDLIYTHDLEGNFKSLNRAGEIISGYTREEAMQMNVSQIIAPKFLKIARRIITNRADLKKPTTYELEIITKQGHRIPLEVSFRLIFQNEIAVGVQGIGRDITERKKSDDALIENERSYRFLSEGIMHQVWTAQPDGRLDYVNGRTIQYLGLSFKEIIGEGWQNVVHPEDLPPCLEKWMHSLETGAYYEVEFRLKRWDGVYRWHLARANAGYDTDGKLIKWFGTNTDIDDKKIAEAKLNFFALHDPLTGLPNRNQFMNHLQQAINRRRNARGANFAILFLDLDRFKVINDSLGHAIGDKLLVTIAERLKSGVRPCDVVARLGGDEFTILIEGMNRLSDLKRIAERLQRKLSQPFKLDNYEVFTSASIGIVVSDKLRREPESYLRDADSAMYRAKESGKARYEIFDREMHVQNLNLLKLETDLRHAIERREFEIFYQPIVSLDAGAICEFEALIRWRHPRYGLIKPDKFISVAEETGLIIPIGNWILGEAACQIRRWQNRFPEQKDLSISVNLSAKQLLHPLLLSQVKEILAETKLDARHLKLEVTESIVMEHREISLSVLEKLNALGISLSTDDFGTGYSSLSYLHQFPFNRLKIDRSFIAQMEKDKKSEAIVKTILMLAQNLKIEAVAEGIETLSQLEILKTFGCEFGQGYLFSEPVIVAKAEQLLHEKSKNMSVNPLFAAVNTEHFIEFEKIQ